MSRTANLVDIRELGNLDESAPRSLTSKICAQLRHDIVTCNLRPDAKLRIADLQERFSVSLSAIREALSRLTSEGYVVAIDQRGFRVAPVSLKDLTDLMRTRVQIESIALTQSIALGDIAWEARLAAAFHTLSRLPRSDPGQPNVMSDIWANAHGSFHRALIDACESPYLLQFRDVLYGQSERYRRLTVNVEPGRDVMTEHELIMKYTLNRDHKKAVSVLEAHFGETARILITHFREAPSVGASGKLKNQLR